MSYFSVLKLTASQRFGKLYNWIHGLCLHVLTGAVATAINYFLMWLLLRGGLSAIPASTLGFCAGAATRFFLSYFHVFSPTLNISATMFRFIGALALQLGANSLLLGELLGLGFPLWIAQVTTTVLLTIFNYVACRIWVFR